MSKKQKLIIGGLSIIFLVGGLFLVKMFYLNKPSETPKEITQKFINAIEKKDNDKLTEFKNKYYTNSLKEELTKEQENEKLDSEDQQEEGEVVFSIANENIEEDNASFVLETKLPLIGEIQLKIKLIKQGDFWQGYNWMINDIVYPDLESSNQKSSQSQKGQLEENVDIGRGWTLTIYSISDYSPSSEWEQPSAGKKFVAIDVQYANNSSSAGQYSSYNFSLKNEKGNTFDETYMSQKEPALGSNTLPAGQKARGYTTFEVPKNSKITQINYSSSSGGTVVWDL